MASHFIVIDSGILIARVFPESITAKAKALLAQWQQQQVRLAAPTLFRYEIISVARKAVFQKRATPEQALKARDFMLSYGVETYLDDALLKRGYELAEQFDRPAAYDSQYLAVAERLNCEFWTTDQRLFNAVKDKLNWVKWVGNFSEFTGE